MSQNAGVLLDRVEGDLATELGKAVRERRESVKIHPDGSMMTQEELAQIFTASGIAMTAADVAALEAGQWRKWDVKMLAALVFLLEISLDEAFAACLGRGASSQEKPTV